MLTDHNNKRYCSSLGEGARKLISWHTDDNRETRDSDRTYNWNLRQIAGGYMAHITEFIELLDNTQSLERAHFAMTEGDINNLEDGDIHVEDAFAQFHAFSLWSLATQRARRNLGFVRGWPKRLHLLDVEDRKHGVLKQFRLDYEDYKHIEGLVNEKTNLCQTVLDRSVFHKESVKNQVDMATANGWIAKER